MWFEFCGSVHETHNPHLTRSEEIEVSCTESAALERITAGCCRLYFTRHYLICSCLERWYILGSANTHGALSQFFQIWGLWVSCMEPQNLQWIVSKSLRLSVKTSTVNILLEERKNASWLVSKFFYSWLMALVSVISAGISSVYVYTVELGYNVMKGTEYFVSL